MTELERDRVGVISGQGMGDGTVAVVVDSSLRMVNQFTQAVLKSLAVAPEDVSSVTSRIFGNSNGLKHLVCTRCGSSTKLQW